MSIGSVGTLSTLNSTQSAINNSIKKIATGSKHPGASYGAAEYAISRRMESNLRAINQSNSNTQNANAMLATAGGAVNNIVSNLTSLREQLVNAANGTNGDSDRATLRNAMSQTIASIDETARSANYNGINLLDGSQSITVAGTNGNDTVNLGNMSAEGLGLVDSDGNMTIDLTDSASIASALDTVDNALNAALDQATSIGAAQQGLDAQSGNYVTQSESLYDSLSTMDDVDIAAEVTNLKSAQTQNQLALFATQMQMHNRANVLQLLQQ